MNNLNPKEILALKQIQSFVLKFGVSPSVRQLMKLMGYSSPRSAALIIESLSERGFLKKKADGSFQVKDSLNEKDRAITIDVPLVGSVACGTPILADENIEAVFPVSDRLARSPYQYFILRAIGDSMNQSGINDGDFVLVKQQETARSGEKVVALIDDEATIKELLITPSTVLLLPRSTNKDYKPIVLTKDFRIQGVVTQVLPPNIN
jgi:repressor LexA